jgi:uncharacterized damage-inducible protein DinB
MELFVSETARTADQLVLVFEGPSWLGPSLKELLSNVDEERARQRAIPNTHTIWELVLHIAAWMRIARERLSASEITEPTGAEDWPPMTGSWQEAKHSLENETRALQQAILSFPETRLDDPAPASEPQTFYVLLHGVVQHAAYHAGQIAILKK